MVIWFIGMSASGKTTIGKKLYNKVSLSEGKWILLDGDTFRNILGEDLGHSLEDRRKNAYRISRLCEFLSSQNINVIACVLSIFHDNQKYNKENITDYKEVYIDVDFENLVKRDNKALYKKALNGEIENVVGVDIAFCPPYSPDMILDNNADDPNYETMIKDIIKELDIKVEDKYSYTQDNLLMSAHKYQYSAFEGEAFFEKFLEDRALTIDFFEGRLRKIGKVNNTLISKEYKNTDVFILKEFLIYLYNGTEDVLRKEKSIMTLLVKRFEVSKKLYLSYDLKEIRKSSLVYDDLLNYALFSLVLQKYYMLTLTEEKFVYLNAILKTNDIISSIKSDFILSDEIYFAGKAIEGELKIVREIL